MTSFLQGLSNEINGVTDIIAPEKAGEKLEEERIVGEADDEMKKIYSLHSKMVQEINTLKTEHGLFHKKMDLPGLLRDALRDEKGDGLERVSEECKKFKSKLEPLEEKADILEQLFWATAHNIVGTEHGALAIREDWKIVSYQPRSEKSLSPHIIGVSIAGPLFS